MFVLDKIQDEKESKMNIIGLLVVILVAFCVGVYFGTKANTIPLDRDTPEVLRYFVSIQGKTKVYYLVATENIDGWTYKATFSKFKDRLSAQLSNFVKEDEQYNQKENR